MLFASRVEWHDVQMACGWVMYPGLRVVVALMVATHRNWGIWTIVAAYGIDVVFYSAVIQAGVTTVRRRRIA